MDGLKRKGKMLMGVSDLSLVIYEQKILHETLAKTLPCFGKVSSALLKWSYAESNASLPNLYSCWSDLDMMMQTLVEETIGHSAAYRQVFKDINAEGKRLNEIQKEKENSAKRVANIKRQIESAKKSKKSTDKVKLGNLEAELALAQTKDSDMGKVLITKTKEFEEYKASSLRESSITFCDNALETLDKLRQALIAKREVASATSETPIYNGDRISNDGITTVEEVFNSIHMQLPPREAALDRKRCFNLGTRSSSFSAPLETSQSTPILHQSPKLTRLRPHSSPPTPPRNTPAMRAGQTGTLGSSSSSSAVYQGGDEDSDDSDDDHDYQIPTEDIIGTRGTRRVESVEVEEEDEYLAPQFMPEPEEGPKVPPRQESLQGPHAHHTHIDSTAGTSKTPGDYMVVLEETSDHEEPRKPKLTPPSQRSTDSSANSGSNGLGKAAFVRLPRVIPVDAPQENSSVENAKPKPEKSPGFIHRSLDSLKREAMLKRKPAPLPKPKLAPPSKDKPKMSTSPSLDKPMPLPRGNSTEQDVSVESADDSGGVYEVMESADKSRPQFQKSISASSAEDGEPHQSIYYSEVYEREDDEEDSESDYCIADFRQFKKAEIVESGEYVPPSSPAVARSAAKEVSAANEEELSEEDEAIYCNLPR